MKRQKECSFENTFWFALREQNVQAIFSSLKGLCHGTFAVFVKTSQIQFPVALTFGQ